MKFGSDLQLRSSLKSNPLGPNHPVILCTWKPNAILEIGSNFSMTGGSICASANILIGNRVTVGANTTIIDTDFHPIDIGLRSIEPDNGLSKPIIIEDDVFIGMNSIILKGVRIGRGSVIGAGSVISHDVPSSVIVAGNPAKVIKNL